MTPLNKDLLPRKGGDAASASHAGGDDGRGGRNDGLGGGGGGYVVPAPVDNTRPVPVSGATNGQTEAVAYGGGSGKVVTIPEGQPFAGRTEGGGTRVNVFGSSYVFYAVLVHVLRVDVDVQYPYFWQHVRQWVSR